MAGRRGRPRKDALRINVDLSETDRAMLKSYMMSALAGDRIGEIEPLTPTAFANLMMFALGDRGPAKVDVGSGEGGEAFDDGLDDEGECDALDGLDGLDDDGGMDGL